MMLILVFGYLYKEDYLGCITKDFSLCMKSTKYVSATGRFTFRHPNDYPITFKTDSDLVNQYHFDNKYAEWVNFSSEFYPNAGGDRLGSIIIYKNTPYKDIKDFVTKELSSFQVPPDIYYVKVGGKDAVCSSLKHQPSSFNSPSYDCYFLYKGELYRIGFDYNDYYHKLPIEYYEKGRELILSTFTLN